MSLISCFFILRISRLFSDAKKILLYSQNDKSLDGFKELINAVKHFQNNASGKLKVGVLEKLLIFAESIMYHLFSVALFRQVFRVSVC